MLQAWLSRSPTGLSSTSEDVRTLALHVLAYAGFQKSYPFHSVVKDSQGKQPLTYRDSLSIILKNILVIIVLPAKAFDLPFLPRKWTQIGLAIKEFKMYMLDQIAHEKTLIAEGKPGSGTLVSNLVRAGEEPPETTIASVSTSNGKQNVSRALSVDEILGNIFVINFAGHDTTAISTAYAMFLLVAQPEVQDWISEELNFYIPDEKCESWTYETYFPKLKRTLAVLVSASSYKIHFTITTDYLSARNPPSLQPTTRNPQVHRLAAMRPDGQQQNHQHPPRYSRRPHPSNLAYPSPLLGHRLPHMEALPMDPPRLHFPTHRTNHTPTITRRKTPHTRKGNFHPLVRRRSQLPGEEIRAGRVRGDYGDAVS